MRYLSRIMIILLLLCGCADKSYEYIKPINNASYFSLLNDSLKEELLEIYEEELDNYQLEMIGSKLEDVPFKDLNYKEHNLLDYQDSKLVIEVVSVGCSHCLKQIKYYNQEIFENNDDITFIQYFSTGTISQIKDLYSSNGLNMPDKTIVEASVDFYNYLEKIGARYTPFLLFFDHGELIYSKENTTNQTQFEKIKEYIFNNPLKKDGLVDNDCVPVFDVKQRDYEDIKNELSGLSIKRLEDVDLNPLFTYSIMSRSVKYYDLTNGSGYSEISNYRSYSKKDTVIFYLRLNNSFDIDKINLINSIIDDNEEISFICILQKDTNSYDTYIKNNYHLNCPIVTSDSSLPVSLKDIETYKDLACIYIEKGTITGGLTSVDSLEHFNSSLSLFFGNKAIAHLDTNL